MLKEAQSKSSKEFTSVKNVVYDVEMCLLVLVSITTTVMMISLISLLSMITLEIMNNSFVAMVKS